MVAHKSYVRLRIQYGSQTWFLNESEMGILQMTEIQGENNSVLSSKTEETRNLMLMLSLNGTIELLAMANSARWYGLVLRREDCHVLRTLRLKVKARKEGRQGHQRSMLRKK